MLTDTIRPVSVRKAGAGTAVPSGTLATVTADNSDATYIDFNVGDAGNWSLRLGPHTPSAGYQRHQIRGRIRIRTDTGTSADDIDLGRGTEDFIMFQEVPAGSSFTEQFTAWFQDGGYGLDTVGALSDLNIGGGWPNFGGGASEIRTSECYVDIDCRFRPDFSPEIQDNAGVDQAGGTVTDTNQPVMFFGAVAYDGLPALNWEVTVREGVSGGPVVFTQSGTGVPPTSVNLSTGLGNGDYNTTFIARSTIRGVDPFEYSEELTFEIDNTVPPPSPPLVTVDAEYDGYRVSWEYSGGQAWDGDYVVAEVWRDDCTGSQRIAVVPDGLTGSYLDLAIPQLDPQLTSPDCEVATEPCDITYRVRYQGYVSTSIDIPDVIPGDLILGWPSTAASIPAGWSRVTSLDTYHVRGATTTGAASATGGTATHDHTTPAHNHRIGPHNHTLGGPTGASNLNITSRRENGASFPQSDQPHNHNRPEYVGTFNGGDSGNTTPDTNSANNAPLSRDVIWITSDGARTAYPVGALGYSTESVSGWTDDATSAGRFLKGAAAAGNGGATSGSNTHTHTVDSHGHSGLIHDHTVGNTSLSNPASSIEAGGGSGSGRWLPRHTHAMDVANSTTGNLQNATGGTAQSPGVVEPPHRKLRILRNTGGGRQTRIIGLYTGALVDLDPLLTRCDGTNGTPDMRTQFAREKGSGSVNLLGGTTTHTHPITTHDHNLPGHNHTTTVIVRTTGAEGTPTSPGDLGPSPDRDHDHTSADTGITVPPVADAYFPSVIGVPRTGASSHIPVYKEVHFVRVDGQIGGDPLPVPELKITEFASFTVPSLTYDDGFDRLSSFTDRMALVTDRSSDYPRLVVDSTPLAGGLHSVSTTVFGEDLTLTISAEGLPAINRLEALLASDRLYWSPLGGTPGWFAPAGWTVTAPVSNVKVVQITMVRQPWPETPDPADFL